VKRLRTALAQYNQLMRKWGISEVEEKEDWA